MSIRQSSIRVKPTRERYPTASTSSGPLVNIYQELAVCQALPPRWLEKLGPALEEGM